MNDQKSSWPMQKLERKKINSAQTINPEKHYIAIREYICCIIFQPPNEAIN